MAGLLDYVFNSPEGRMGLGLLALGQMPKSQGMPGLMGLFAAQDAATKAKSDTEWQGETRGRQRKEWTQADAAAEAAARQKAAIPRLFTGGEGGGLGGFDVQQALNAGFDPKMIQELASLRNVGRSKVARTVEGMDENGRPVTYQVDEFGQRVGDVIGQWKQPVMVNQGSHITAVDPATMQARGQFGVNMSAAERDSSARGWAGNSLAKQRLAFDMGGGADVGPGQAGFVRQFGKPPAGYRWKPDGELEAIPGGPTDIKTGEAGAKTEQRKALVAASAGNVLGTVRDALKLVGITTTGPGSVIANVPGTDARDLRAKLETIKANLGFDRLQQMREASPTGGALGAVAVQELTALQSTVASLDQAQSPAELKKSLERIDKHYNKWLSTVQSAPQTGGASGGWGDKGGKTVTKTGMYGGKKVVQYSDGSVDYAD